MDTAFILDFLFNTMVNTVYQLIQLNEPQGFKKKNHGSCIFQVSFILFHQLFHKLRRGQYVYTFSRYGACAGIKKILKIKKLTHKKASTSICKYKMHNIERVVHTSVLDIINKVNCHKVTVV